MLIKDKKKISPSIRILSSLAISQIAAGEVIEDPASLVKELVENAIDAESSSIRIDLEKGGFSLVRVSDNGCGMDRENLSLSVIPHATSKIFQVDDLQNIRSLGFRGEALSSIASIGSVAITSASAEEAPLAYRLTIEEGEKSSITRAVRPVGTTVEVTNLFHNVPVRKSFQKSAKSSLSKVIRVVTQLALSFPGIKWVFYADGKEVFRVVPKEGVSLMVALRECAKQTMGSSFVDHWIPLKRERKEISLQGYLSPPSLARANRSGQFLFINGRSLVSPFISQSVQEGYGTYLGSHLHPSFILHMILPPSWVDVNVHPQKRQVRFRLREEIKEALLEGVASSFGNRLQTPEKPHSWKTTPFSLCEEPSMSVAIDREKEEKGELELPFVSSAFSLPIIGLFRSFLLVDHGSWSQSLKLPENRDWLFLIDLVKAESKVFYERHIAAKEETPPLQQLLTPIVLSFTKSEEVLLASSLDSLFSWGIALRCFGKGVYVVEALAVGIDPKRVKELILELLERREGPQKTFSTFSKYRLFTRKNWTLEEAKRVCEELFLCKDPFYTPNGQSIIGWLSDEHIKKCFS